MTDESTAAMSQPSAAGEEGQGNVPSDYSAFLGPPSPETDLSAPETPAPGTGDEEAEPEAPKAPGQEGEPEEEAPPTTESEPEEEESEQQASVEERLKDLTPRETEQYAQRYPNAWRALQDPKTPEDLKHLLLDKIDSDHEIQRRIAEEQAWAEQEEEPTFQEPERPETPQQQLDVNQQRTAYYEGIDNLVKTQFDQQSVKEVGDTLLRMFNVNVKALDDPAVSAEDKAILRGLVDSVQREAPVLARFMADAVSTTVPYILPAALEMAVPGFTETYERHMFAGAYESVRQQTDERGRPLYPDLPPYPAVKGTAEAQEFSDLLRQAADEIPGFEDMVFRDQRGRVLPQQQQAQLKYNMLARHLSGQRMNPAYIAEAVETGRRLAGRADSRRQTAGISGAGQGTAGPLGRGGAGDEDDPVLAALDAEIARQEVNYSQVVRGRQSGR